MKDILSLQSLQLKLESLRQGITPYGLAPHKPVLLLSLIDYYEEMKLTQNHFKFDEHLHRIFKENWQLLVDTQHDCDITKPLYYLQSDQLWTLSPKFESFTERDLTSYGRFDRVLSHGELSATLFECLKQEDQRELLRVILLSRYFAKTEQHYFNEKGVAQELLQTDEQILREQAPTYAIKKVTVKVYEAFIRDIRFRRQVLNAYNHTCAMTQYSNTGAPIIEACHIANFALTGNNSIQNGIALCANLHRAFDAGLISLDDDYCILVKGDKKFQEAGSNPLSLRQLKGKKILLPTSVEKSPSRQYLAEHRFINGF